MYFQERLIASKSHSLEPAAANNTHRTSPMKPSLLLPICGFVALTAPRASASALLKPTSGVTQALTAKSLSVESHLRGAFARTTVTTVYSNPNNDRIEADFLYSAPKGSVVTGFAYWYGKEKVIARVVEKGRAAKIYQYITSRMRDPALIEMVGKNSFRARIFPIEARNDLKIEIKLAQTLPQTKAGPLWTYPLREETRGGALQNVNIRVHSGGSASSNMGAFKNGELQIAKRNFIAKEDLRALVQQKPAPMRASLVAARDGGPDGFFALSLTPNSSIANPVAKISGIATYEVVASKQSRILAGQALVVTGRYRGSGRAVVSLGEQSFEVVFPDMVEKNNLASSLWAANRIEALSESTANEKKVMALSKRFGVPSKWTSWLAIPEEERRSFKHQMMVADRADAARAYAQALARTDSIGAKAQKDRFDTLTKQLATENSENGYEELQPLSSYLNDELRRLKKAAIQAKYEDSVSKSQQAQWRTWAQNLRKAGADDGGKGVELPVYVVEDELRIASRLYMQEIEVGRRTGAKARSLQARLKELAKTQAARDCGWDENSFLEEEAGVRAKALAMDIAAGRTTDKIDRRRERELKARLRRLEASTDIDADAVLQEALQSVWGVKVEAIATKWAGEIEAGRADGTAARRFEREVRALQKRSGLKQIDSLDSAWTTLMNKTAQTFAPAIGQEGPSGKAAQRLEAEVLAVSKRASLSKSDISGTAWGEVSSEMVEEVIAEIRSGRGSGAKALELISHLRAVKDQYHVEYTDEIDGVWDEFEREVTTELATEIKEKRDGEGKARQLTAQLQEAQNYTRGNNKWLIDEAWAERARQTYTEKIQESLKNGDDSPRVQELEEQGQTLAAKAKADSTRLEQEAAQRLMQTLDSQVSQEHATDGEEDVRDTRKKLEQKVEELDRRLALNTNNYSLRPGDPLISVMAPADCRQVLALMPDGSLLPLRYDTGKGAWEARFDVPTAAEQGDYRVQIVIVAADGLRKRLVMNFSVDMVAPRGAASLRSDDGHWNLRLETDEQTKRVSAFLPWNERVELRRELGGIFTKQVSVPTQINGPAQVRFILTDKAHNRTEVFVDWK
jgi:hypothetical protein